MEIINCEQTRIGNSIERIMGKDARFKRVDVDYINLNYKSDNGYFVKLYINDYDYIKVALNFKEEIPTECYIEAINSAIKNKNYHCFKATPEEIYVSSLLDAQYRENQEFNLCFIDDGHLCKDDGGETSIDFSAIAKIKYDYGIQILELEEMEGYTVIVDFKNNTMVGFDED